MKKAEPAKRILAFIVDSLIAMTFFGVSMILAKIPVLGFFIGLACHGLSVAYFCFRDALPMKELDGASIGKKALGIKAVNRLGETMSLKQSFKRNITFTFPMIAFFFLQFLGRFGIVIITIISVLGIIILIMELVKLVSDEHGLRIGDLLAETRVISIS